MEEDKCDKNSGIGIPAGSGKTGDKKEPAGIRKWKREKNKCNFG